MAGLVPAIHVCLDSARKTQMPAASAGVTILKDDNAPPAKE
jgi:hypothetical protein